MRMDAMVAERLTASPRIYDVYGHCGLSLFTEFFRHGTIEDVLFTDENDSDDSRSEDEAGIPVARNDLSPSQKLELALNLAEAVADLHGHVDGAIVHQDITPSQLMWNEDRTMVKLNDFNRAEFMLWNDKRGQYCDYRQPDIRYVSIARMHSGSRFCCLVLFFKAHPLGYN
jgi:serine/threonine protein kinase